MNKRIIGLILMLSLLLAAVGLAETGSPVPSGEALVSAGFYPVTEVMDRAGYMQTGDYVYETWVAEGVTIRVVFDPEGMTCSKNQYIFDLTEDQLRLCDGALYLSAGAIEAILACSVSYGDEGVALTPRSFGPGAWMRLSGLIAHAGGAVRRVDYWAISTNSLEALVENYTLGHRVFEFDFQLTADGALALVHDWKRHGMSNGKAMTADAWKASKEAGNPATQGRFTTMLVEDLLDQMLVNRDMFVVTDTKATKITPEEVVREFELIRDAALARDPELLDRIVPQVYNPDTYELTMSVYDWQSVIYTTYSNKLPADEIIRFAAEKENIHVITASHSDKRFTAEEIRQAHDAGLLFYTHTLNTYADITEERGRGVDGLYTDLLIGEQMALYDRLAVNGEAADAGEASAPADESQARYFLPPAEISPTFEGFLKYARGLRNCEILLATRGEAVQGLSDGALDLLSKLGVKTDLSVADGCSFIAAIKESSVAEKAGYSAIKHSGKLADGAKYTLASAGDYCGDACSIKINGEEYAPGTRGFNIVVYSTALHKVIHSGAYDTHVADQQG